MIASLPHADLEQVPVAHAATNQRGRIRLTFRATPRTVKPERDQLAGRDRLVARHPVGPLGRGDPRVSCVRNLIQLVGTIQLLVRVSVVGGLNVAFDANPAGRTWRIVQNATIRMIRSAPVGVTQPSPQCLGVREVEIWGLTMVIQDARREFLVSPLRNVVVGASRTLGHRRHSRRVGVRSLNQQAARLVKIRLDDGK